MAKTHLEWPASVGNALLLWATIRDQGKTFLFLSYKDDVNDRVSAKKEAPGPAET